MLQRTRTSTRAGRAGRILSIAAPVALAAVHAQPPHLRQRRPAAHPQPVGRPRLHRVRADPVRRRLEALRHAARSAPPTL